jgi:glutamate synthase domain-containing protein 3
MTGGRVIVLGPTGRNFAAGMSGGVAYIWDTRGDFARRCNMELVGLDEIDGEDEQALHVLIDEHRRRTGSPVAERILANWDVELRRFVKVMPHDYKRALQEQAAVLDAQDAAAREPQAA